MISTVGITRQKDGLTYMDVDYQANANLLNEAKKAGKVYLFGDGELKLNPIHGADLAEVYVDAIAWIF